MKKVLLIALALLVLITVAVYACHLTVTGKADCDGFDVAVENHMGQDVVLTWEIVLEKGDVVVDEFSGQSGVIPDGDTYSIAGEWVDELNGTYTAEGCVQVWAPGSVNLDCPTCPSEPLAEECYEATFECHPTAITLSGFWVRSPSWFQQLRRWLWTR